MPRVVREKEMQVPSAALLAAITRFDEYPLFLAEVVSARIEAGATPACTRVAFELEIIKRFQYTLEFNYQSENEVIWKLHEGSFFKKNEGRWGLIPRGQSTHVTYELDVEFGFMVPGWIAKRLTEVSLPKLFENYEARAALLKKEGKLG